MASVDDLAQQQRETAEWIKKISEKYTKEPKVRRTKEFVKERLDDLNHHWKEFQNGDKQIREHEHFSEKHPYIKANFYTQVEATMTTIRSKLEGKLKEILEEESKVQNVAGLADNSDTARPITTPSTSGDRRSPNNVQDQQDEEQERRMKRQEAQKQAFFRSVDRMEKTPQTSKAYYVHKQQAIQSQWMNIVKTHNDIIEHACETTADDYMNEQEELEQIYEDVMVNIQKKIDTYEIQHAVSTRQDGTTENMNHDLKLPVLKLPTFNGDYKQWKSFFDLFEQAIHKNDKLGKAQKMHYLKTNVTGEAAKIIQHLQITDNNYETAREAMINRYENTRMLVNAQIQALINQKECQFESADNLKRLHDTSMECVNALKGLNIDTKSWDPIILYIISQKMDSETRKAYEQSLKKPKDLQPLDEFFTFLENKFHALDNLEEKKQRGDNPKDKKPFNNRKGFLKNFYTTVTPFCKACNGTHWLHTCSKFIQMSVTQRNEVIQREKLCKNCFKPNHDTSRCPSAKSCQICHQRHHTLLHSSYLDRQSQHPQTNFSANKQCNETLLATAVVKTNWKGCDYFLRALIDQGSQSSFITEDAVQRLQLQRKRANASITGLGATHAGTANSKVELQIQSIYPSEFQSWGEFLVLNNLTRLLPEESFTTKDWNHIKHLPLADPAYNKKAAIDMLIGADVFQDIILEGVIKGNHGTPVAQNTQLGWILSGSIQHRFKKHEATVCLISNTELNDQLKSFWEIEEVQEQIGPSEEETRCEEIFRTTHKRNEEGRYIVRLPFKEDTCKLGESKDRALARFLQIEKKFSRNKQLHDDYVQFIREYIELGHMEEVNPTAIAESTEKVYYLPHHAVIKPDSSSTKVRVVFDASSRTSSGVSLNDTMLTGPVIQQDLYSILVRWRKHRIVYRADIEKMYRQILVAHEDRDFQRILWRENPTQKIKEYRLKTVTYGTSSAPYLAIRTLQQLACDEKKKFETASNITCRDFYVDDVLSGADTLDEAVEAQRQLVQLMAKGGFRLHKWSSNTKAILKNVTSEDQEQGRSKINGYDPIKTLGIYWRPESDTFEFKVNIAKANNKDLTKRIIVSETARLFDPLGWLAPIIVKAKLIQQQLWKSEKTWDEILTDENAHEWKTFRSQLSCIEEIKIPRWIQYGAKNRIELHGFCDASERAFAAVIYTRITTASGEIITRLLCAKTKVAPIKKVSIPRLELCGAVLLAKLLQKTKAKLEIKDLETHAWTDSSITLAWITGNPNKWKNYVAARVTIITKILSSDKWHHVKGKDNPADCASRGLWPSELKAHSIWWAGPSWLAQAEVNYTDPTPHRTNEEVKKMHINTFTSTTEPDLIGKMLSQYSTFRRITRILALCKRFVHNLRSSKDNKQLGQITCEEIEGAAKVIIRHVQQTTFKDEIVDLKRRKEVDRKSKVRCLNPFLDEDEVMRVGGRLAKAELSSSQKYPIIVPHSGYLTTMLIDEAHKTTLHGGYALTHVHLRQQYWILSGLSAVKQRVRRCTTCFRHRTSTRSQMMGNLPQPRVSKTRAFLHTGVDYAGPIDIRTAKGRGNKSYKGYIALFICLATKAVHLEVVSDLTANAFIAAFKRLCARRGHVGHLYSDNGTNFVAANKILQLNARDAKGYDDEICDALTTYHTEWHFIPPAAPHFGGLWEAGVKSVKHHLKRTIGEHKLTYEEMSTLLSQIEACLNSRPLCPISNDPDEIDVLTPGHFLIGTTLLAPPERHRLNEREGLLTRWQLLERLQQNFWKRWSSEYLTTLQQRRKWTTKNENLRVGNIVLVKDEQLPPTRWMFGKVIETHAGEDGLVRVVTIKARNKIYKRPVTKICLLPISDNEEQIEIQDDNKQTARRTTTTCLSTFLSSVPVNKNPPIELPDEIQCNTQESKKRRKKGPWLKLLYTMLVVTALGRRSATASDAEPEGFKVTPFRNRPGIYFEKIGNINLIMNDWRIIAYYDLTDYWRELSGFEKLINEMNEFCKMKGADILTHNIIQQFNHQLTIIKGNNDLLLKQGAGRDPATRMKRSPFDFVGTVANKLFGVLDESYAEHYEEQIQQTRLNEKHLLKLIRNQTSIAESTSNILQKNTQAVTAQLQVFHNNIENLKSYVTTTSNQTAAEQKFLAMSTYTTLAMVNYQQVQKSLLDVLTDLHHAKVNPLILTPDQLRAQLEWIRKHLPPQLSVAEDRMDSNLLALYRLLSVKARITQQNVIFDIRLPLIKSEDYEMFKVIPVPTPHRNEFIFIEPSLDYLVVNLLRESYYRLTREELSKCTRISDRYLCQQQHPMFNRQSNVSRCEMDLLTHTTGLPPFCKLRSIRPSPIWIQLNSANSWIYVLDRKYTFNVICGRRILEVSLQDDGILTLESNCILKQDTMSITAYEGMSSRLNAAFIPATNITAILANDPTNISKPLVISHPSLQSNNEEYDTLNKRIADLKNSEELPANSMNHRVHYSISYSLIGGLFITIVVYIVWQRKRRRTITVQQAPVPATRRPATRRFTTSDFNI